MSEIMKTSPADIMQLAQVCELLVKSSYCGVKKIEDAVWLAATGHVLGIDPLTSLRGIHVIGGKPVLSADLMAAVAMRHPDCEYLRVAEMTAERATVHVKRKGWPEHTAITFSVDDAKAAGLLNNPTWKKYPADMCKARAIARAARAAFPDALLGVYVEGEIDETAQEPARATVVQAAPPAPLQLEGEVVDVTPEVDEVTRWRELMGECGLSGDALPAASAACAQGFGLASVRELPNGKLGKVNDKLAGMTPDARREYMNDKIAGLEGKAA